MLQKLVTCAWTNLGKTVTAPIAGSKSAPTSYALPVKDLQLIFLASFLRTPVSVMHITLLLLNALIFTDARRWLDTAVFRAAVQRGGNSG